MAVLLERKKQQQQQQRRVFSSTKFNVDTYVDSRKELEWEIKTIKGDQFRQKKNMNFLQRWYDWLRNASGHQSEKWAAVEKKERTGTHTTFPA